MKQADLTDFATRYAAAWSSQDPAKFASFYAENGPGPGRIRVPEAPADRCT